MTESAGAGGDFLREQLVELESREARLSAERARLQHQIDAGFGTERTRGRERRISEERRQLHRRIDLLREALDILARSSGTRARPL